MSKTSLIDEFVNELKGNKKVVYFNSARTEINIRCPYCGDSRKNNLSAHLYISVNPPHSFFCQRCETKGFLSMHNIRDFEVENLELAHALNKSAKGFFKNTSRSDSDINSLLSGKRKMLMPQYREDKYHNHKVKYLENRFNTELDKRDLFNLKVITNITDFIEINKNKNLDYFFKKSDYHKALIEWLDKMSVGFLSTDTNYTTFRHTRIPNNGRRYYTQNNNGHIDIGNKIYTIRNKVDILTPELNLVLAEGSIDIISIYLNMYDRLQNENTIFSAVNGKTYPLVISLLRRMGFTKINLDLYSDREISLDFYKYIFNYDHFSKIRVHYNMYDGEKDFGVGKEKIKKKTYKLK